MPATLQNPLMITDSQCFIASRATARTGCLVLALLAVPAWSQVPSASSTVATTFSSKIDEICPEAVREAVEQRLRKKTPNVHAPPSRPLFARICCSWKSRIRRRECS
jgi:hypothetical protein